MMPDAHYPDCVTEANRDEIRRMGSLLHRLEDQNQHGKMRDEIRRRDETIEAQREVIDKLRGQLFDAVHRLARLRAGGKG
jgi:hypothetical protein